MIKSFKALSNSFFFQGVVEFGRERETNQRLGKIKERADGEFDSIRKLPQGRALTQGKGILQKGTIHTRVRFQKIV